MDILCNETLDNHKNSMLFTQIWKKLQIIDRFVMRNCLCRAVFQTKFIRRNFASKSFYGPRPNLADDEGIPPDFKILEIVLEANRLDHLLHSMLKMSKSAVEKNVREQNIRMDEVLVTKKAAEIEEGNEIDVWMSEYEDNNALARIQRLLVTNFNMQDDGYMLPSKWSIFA